MTGGHSIWTTRESDTLVELQNDMWVKPLCIRSTGLL